MSGTITAHKHQELDVFGLTVAAIITAVGGGTVRDILLDAHPIAWISHSAYIISMVAGAIAGLLSLSIIDRFKKPFIFIDALGISFAALAGLQKGLEYDANPLAAIFFGVITATVGGIIRDIICNEVPMVLRKEIYAGAVMLGCIVYLLLDSLGHLHESVVYTISFFVIVLTRMFAVRYGWDLNFKPRNKRTAK